MAPLPHSRINAKQRRYLNVKKNTIKYIGKYRISTASQDTITGAIFYHFSWGKKIFFNSQNTLSNVFQDSGYQAVEDSDPQDTGNKESLTTAAAERHCTKKVN